MRTVRAHDGDGSDDDHDDDGGKLEFSLFFLFVEGVED